MSRHIQIHGPEFVHRTHEFVFLIPVKIPEVRDPEAAETNNHPERVSIFAGVGFQGVVARA
jgi:hypothetical protein